MDYAYAQLARAVRAAVDAQGPEAEQNARARMEAWVRVLSGMADGSVRVGSRKPTELPEWATLEVVRGGFATGRAKAESSLRPDEVERAARLGIEPSLASVFASWLTPEGLAELDRMLVDGAYAVPLPEDGALLAVAALIRLGDEKGARALLAEITPFADRLHFTPIPTRPVPERGTKVFRQTAEEVAESLERRQPRRDLVAQKEAIEVWLPLTDQVVEWWAGREVIGDDDRSAAADLVSAYDIAAATARWCGKYRNPKENLPILVGELRRVVAGELTEPSPRVWHVLASIEAKRGLPSSARSQRIRASQRGFAGRPLYAELAHVVAERLRELRPDDGVEDLAPVTAGLELPTSVARVAGRARVAEVEELVEDGTLPSAETLALLVPQLSAPTVGATIPDPTVRRLVAEIYKAFRRRRSLLLWHLQSQVRLGELPWAAALLAHGDGAEVEASTAGALRLGTLYFNHFPGKLVPNNLVEEFRTLTADAQLPWLKELAADIFEGRFSPVYVAAGRLAAKHLKGSLYERYYGIDYGAVVASRDKPRRWGKHPGLTDFDRMCGCGDDEQWSVARNGKIIERQQVITTHNAITLVELGCRPSRGWDWTAVEAARDAFRLLTVAARQERPLATIKNAAYAWRQAVLYWSMAGRVDIEALKAVPGADGDRAEEVVAGLTRCLAGDEFQPFTGWVA